jgi:hypothetical protein
MMSDEPQYSLTADEPYFVDQNGVSWDSPKDWLFMGVLGGCGCGSSDELAQLAMNVLDNYALPHDERTLRVYDDMTLEVLAHWIDSKGLIEHGSSIGGSWLSPLGKVVHAELRKYR